MVALVESVDGGEGLIVAVTDIVLICEGLGVRDGLPLELGDTEGVGDKDDPGLAVPDTESIKLIEDVAVPDCVGLGLGDTEGV